MYIGSFSIFVCFIIQIFVHVLLHLSFICLTILSTLILFIFVCQILPHGLFHLEYIYVWVCQLTFLVLDFLYFRILVWRFIINVNFVISYFSSLMSNFYCCCCSFLPLCLSYQILKLSFDDKLSSLAWNFVSLLPSPLAHSFSWRFILHILS